MGKTSSPVQVFVFAPEPLLTVTIEGGGPDKTVPEVHVHPGGQGIWLARMAESLGAQVTVCGPFGGETGSVTAHLAREEGLDVRPTPGPANGAYVHDRRDGERTEIARMPGPVLDRHALDDLYGTALVTALDAGVCILTGTEEPKGVPADFFERLASDLRAGGHTVVADLSGDQARALLEVEGCVLKMSDDELVEGGFADDDEQDSLLAAARQLVDGGLGGVVVSRATGASLAVDADGASAITTPEVSTADHRGAGDSMTAGIAVGLARGLGLAEAARLGAAAGALNVTRRGLGTGPGDQIERFTAEVEVTPI